MSLRVAIALSALVLLVSGVATPAAANISSATLASPSTSYSGPCPTTMSFNGSVAGAAGTKFTVAFNRYLNGVQQVVDKGPFTMPAGGSVSVSDSISVAATTSGSTFDQIWVHGISAGQPDVYSNKVNFSVTCGPVPTPVPAGPAPPTNLKATTDPAVCGDHVAPLFGALICGAALKDGDLILVWDYPDAGSVDGFHIYQLNGSTHTLVDKQSGMTGKALSVKAADAKSLCYVVRAYKGSTESADSNSTCTPTIGLVTHVHTNLPISALKYVYHFSHYYSTATYCFYTGGLGGHELDYVSGNLLVGYVNSWDPGTDPFPCYEKIDHAYRSAVKFDLAPLAGKKLWKAVLTFTTTKSWAAVGTPATCATEMMYGIGDWTGAKDLIPGDSYQVFPTGAHVNVSNPSVHIVNSTTFSIDVTDAVRAWLDGSRPNWGFVFRGAREDYAKDNDVCTSLYGNVALGVDYFNYRF